MADAARAARLADRIKVIVARALERRIKDPRLGFVTVTEARVTNDLQHATVYYTVYGTEEETAGTRAALESAKGVLRSEVGKNITARLTPTLTFVPDEVPENASHIEDILRKARARDAELAEAAEGAAYAGGADPYKREDENEAEEDLLTAYDPVEEELPGEAGQEPADPDSGAPASAEEAEEEDDAEGTGRRSGGTE